jgi:hypothetical protein
MASAIYPLAKYEWLCSSGSFQSESVVLDTVLLMVTAGGLHATWGIMIAEKIAVTSSNGYDIRFVWRRKVKIWRDSEHLLLAKNGSMGRRRKYKVSDGK